MSDLELCYATTAEAGRRIAARELSPVELTAALLRRIEETDGEINSYVRLMRDSALAEAQASENRAQAGELIGPLDGIPVGVKDLYDTAGVVTAAGTAAYSERVPAEDATAVRLLREAGAVIIGKTNTHELAMGGTTNNAHFGATHNPWKLDRVPGGSSGGSGAALAAGQALGALGTDTGGSIRVPAAFCGVTGLKPTFGLIGRGGIVPLSMTRDHAGPMARSVEDCALMLNALAGPDPRDLDSAMREGDGDYTSELGHDISGLRLAVIPSLVEGCEAAVATNFERSLEVLRELGAEVGTVEPLAGFADDWRGLTRLGGAAEGASYIEDVLRRNPEKISEPMRGRLLEGLEAKAVDLVRATEARKEVERRYELALSTFDAYVLPTSPMTAEPIADDPTAADPASTLRFRNTGVFNSSRQPAISVPNGFDADGLPTGLMVAAAQFRDAVVLNIAHIYQTATTFHLQRPLIEAGAGERKSAAAASERPEQTDTVSSAEAAAR